MAQTPVSPIAEPRAFARPEAAAGAHLVQRARWHAGLNQAEFARAYRIDLDRLRRLEQGHAEPDPALAAYLRVIDRAPTLVAEALGSPA